MKEKLDKIIDNLTDQMITDLKGLLQINSVRDVKGSNAPYGKGIRNAFDYVAKLCERDGLKVVDVDGYMIYGQWQEYSEYIGIFGHLDVVETGDGWIYLPFSGHIENNRFYSRGALDNKGPIIAAYYGLLALMKSGFLPKYSIRIVFGGNEESGMEDISYYLSKQKEPILGFTPDNKFPAIYGERGRMTIECLGSIDDVIIFVNEYLMNSNNNGDRLGINFSDKDFGMMQIRNKKFIYKEQKLGIEFSLSYPNIDSELILKQIKSKAPNLECRILRDIKPILHNPLSTLVQTLNLAYNEYQQTDLKPTTTTGGTYAHVCTRIIPFGPSFPNQNGIAHQPNEWFDIDDLIKCAKIYAYALYKLSLLENIDIELDD